jgi:hypothetical protein
MKLPAVTATTATMAAAITIAAALSAIAAAGRLGPSFVHVYGAAVQFGSVQVRYRVLGSFRVAHFDECESAWLTRFAVGHEIDSFYVAVRSERILEVSLGCLITEISDKNVGHSESFSGVNYLCLTALNQRLKKQEEGR